MKLKPLYDKILVKRVEQESKTSSGIIIPDAAQEKPIQGEVLAIGDGTLLENGTVRPLSVKVGETVLFAKWGGTEIKLDGVEYLIMKESDILGIIQK